MPLPTPFSVVMVEHLAHSLVAEDIREPDQVRFIGFLRVLRRDQQVVARGLVPPHLVVLAHHLVRRVVHVPLAEHDEVVQAFLFQRLDERLHERHDVRRPEGRLLDTQLCVLQRVIAVLAELVVAVVHYDIRLQAAAIYVLDEGLFLFSPPYTEAVSFQPFARSGQTSGTSATGRTCSVGARRGAVAVWPIVVASGGEIDPSRKRVRTKTIRSRPRKQRTAVSLGLCS